VRYDNARYDNARLNTGDYILVILSNDASEFGLRGLEAPGTSGRT
jgi:hypothetical protein